MPQESPEGGKHTLMREAQSHGKECCEGRSAEEEVKRSRKIQLNHFRTTAGSRAGRRPPRSGAGAWQPLLFGKSQVSVPGLLHSAAGGFSSQIRRLL